ncbi:hypothetical protein Q7P37_010114 [Cladosporium fusiforme]
MYQARRWFMSNFSPAMGNASSQLASTQTDDNSQQVPETQESPLQAASAMDGASQHDEPRVNKRRNASGDAIRPTKKSKKDREHDFTTDLASGLEHDDELVQATEEVTRKRSKKKSKREEAQRDDENISNEIPATQESFLSQELPRSTADIVNGGESSKPAKSKRKKPKGRPSGLNLVPASTSEPATQENTTQETPASPAVMGGFTAVNSPVQHFASQTPSKKPHSSKHAKRTSAHMSPELINTQDSQPPVNGIASPVDRNTRQKDDVPTTPKDGQQPAKRSKTKKQRESRVEQHLEQEILPTPPGANEDASLNIGDVPTPPDTVPEDDGALRDDYSEVDATGQVKGWLSEQVPNGIVPETPRVTASGSAMRKKAALNSAQRTEGEKQKKQKQKRVSQHQADDSDDYQANGQASEEETSKSKRASKRKSMQSQDAAVDEIDETPAKTMASPRASKKQRRSSKGNEDVIVETPKQQKRTKPKSKSRKDNMRDKSPVVDVADESEQAGSPAQTNEEPAKADESNAAQKKRSRKDKDQATVSKKRSADQTDVEKKATESGSKAVAKGPFTAEEKDKVDKIFKDVMEKSGMSDAEFRTSLQNWKDAVDFKKAVEDALPARPLAAVRKFCQRRYHNLERGPWTQEQDESLKNAYVANPDKWTEISALVGRTAADCKDRWRNYVSIEKTAQLGPWSREDEAALAEAVGACIKEMKKANKGDKNFPTARDDLESMVSWTEVAKKLGGTRSAKRCHEKWQKLKKRKENGGSNIPTKPSTTDTGSEGGSKKLKAAEKLYNQCGVGDLFDILTEIHTAIPNHALHYDRESTVWSTISLQNKGSKFTSAMRRHGLQDATKIYTAEVSPQPTIAATAKALADHLLSQWGPEALRKNRIYDPSSATRKKIKSSERVDSDEDGSDDEAPGAAITTREDSDEEVSEAEVAKSQSDS